MSGCARSGGETWAVRGAAFVFVTSETLPVGLLPKTSSDLAVSEGRNGFLRTFYVIVVGSTAIPFRGVDDASATSPATPAGTRIVPLSQAGAALAPNFWWLVAARLVCALGHGPGYAYCCSTTVRPG